MVIIISRTLLDDHISCAQDQSIHIPRIEALVHLMPAAAVIQEMHKLRRIPRYKEVRKELNKQHTYINRE